jgi:hypothetical protein
VRRFFSGLLLAALLGSAQAADAPPPATPAATAANTPADAPAAEHVLEIMPGRKGYAVGQPDILLRQRLFGRIHGLSLLTATCVGLPAYSAAVRDAYAAWYEKQAKAIATIVRDMNAYYFGPRAGEARWSDLTRALNLPESIEPALSEVTLHAACASLPEAIPRPRYELDKFLAGTLTLEALPDITAVPQAPTLQKPGE